MKFLIDGAEVTSGAFYERLASSYHEDTGCMMPRSTLNRIVGELKKGISYESSNGPVFGIAID